MLVRWPYATQRTSTRPLRPNTRGVVLSHMLRLLIKAHLCPNGSTTQRARLQRHSTTETSAHVPTGCEDHLHNNAYEVIMLQAALAAPSGTALLLLSYYYDAYYYWRRHAHSIWHLFSVLKAHRTQLLLGLLQRPAKTIQKSSTSSYGVSVPQVEYGDAITQVVS